MSYIEFYQFDGEEQKEVTIPEGMTREEFLNLKVRVGFFDTFGGASYGVSYSFRMVGRKLKAKKDGHFKTEKPFNGMVEMTIKEALNFEYDKEKIRFNKFLMRGDKLCETHVLKEEGGEGYAFYLVHSGFEISSFPDYLCISKRAGNAMLEKAKKYQVGDYVRIDNEELERTGSALNGFGGMSASFEALLKNKEVWKVASVWDYGLKLKDPIVGNDYNFNILSIGEKLTAEEVKEYKKSQKTLRIKKLFSEHYRTIINHKEGEIREALRKYFRFTRENQLLELKESESEQEFFKDFEKKFDISSKLARHSLIEEVIVDSDNLVIQVITRVLTIEESDDEDLIGEFSGKFLFVLDCLKNDFKIYSELEEELRIHPHVDSGGVPCWGNLWGNFNGAVLACDWSLAVECMLTLVQSVYTGSTYWELYERNEEGEELISNYF